MSDKKTLLEEGTIRRFMKLANMEAVGDGFVNEMYGKPMMKDDKTRPPEKKEDEKKMEEDVDLEEGSYMKADDKARPPEKKEEEDEKKMEEVALAGKMADDDDMKDDPMEEMMGKDHGGMKDDAMADDMEMDLDVKDEEEEMDMDAGDMGELTLTDEEAEIFLKVADKVRAAMEMDGPEKMDAPDMGGMDEPMDEPMMEEDVINEVARRVAKRLKGLKKSK